MGYDPRIQLCHEDDALEILQRATQGDHPGTFNAGGDGVILLSQAIRRAGRAAVPIPPGAVSLVGNVFRRTGLVDFSPEQLRFLEFGRVVDVAKLHETFGYRPRYTTLSAFDEWAGSADRRHLYTPEQVLAVERGVLNLTARGQAVLGRDPRRVPYPEPSKTGGVLSA
jgi:UDP-glucose 4-epimerase